MNNTTLPRRPGREQTPDWQHNRVRRTPAGTDYNIQRLHIVQRYKCHIGAPHQTSNLEGACDALQLPPNDHHEKRGMTL